MFRSTSRFVSRQRLDRDGATEGVSPRRSTLGWWRSALASAAVAAVLVACASHPAQAQRGGGMSPQGWAQRGHRGHRRMGGGMMSDAAARLLDHQMMLGLSGDQVTRLIAVHQQLLTSARPIREKMLAMFRRTPGQQRPQLTGAQRDSVGGMMESLREIKWKSAASADAVLTDEQRKAATRLMSRAGGAGRRGGQGGRGGSGGPGMRGGRPQPPGGDAGGDDGDDGSI